MAVLGLLCVGPGLAAVEAEAGPLVFVHRLDGVIHPASSAAFSRALERAREQRAALFVLEVDTPGGLVSSATDMVQEILASPVPVCVYVTPSGAHAASAGFFLLQAADVAAMAPVTTTGAAHPITAGGENKEGDILLKKVAEDLSALIRSAARARGRPAELAEKAVTEAKSWSAEEALEVGLIDVVAQDRGELIAALDGREVRRADASALVLRLDGPRLVEHRLNWKEEFKNVLLRPEVMALILSIAMLGIYIELTHPGLILPGAVGVLGLLIFLYGSQMLPVNYFAVALIAVAGVMFLLEVKVVSYGLLSVGGTACLALGLWLLFPRGVVGLEFPMLSLVMILAFLLVCIGGVMYFVIAAQRSPVDTGREGMLGLVGEARTELAPQGTVWVRGEYWTARSGRPVAVGGKVRVTGVEGLTLRVEPLADDTPTGSAAAAPQVEE
ncbi:MAG: nodulation protein NfeD [Acidobacteriota bacterium]|nr:nodulation protein NfeD [Acidobacteriota bacterium]